MSGLDDKGGLLLRNGKKMAQLTVSHSMVVDRTVAIYGPSGTGKTVIARHLMKIISPMVDQAIIVSPTEQSNKSYEGIVDSPFIHYRMFLPDPNNPKKDDGPKGALRFLETVWKRQEMQASVYNQANDKKSLEALYRRLPKDARAEALKYIKTVSDKAEKVLHLTDKLVTDPSRRDAKKKEIREKYQRMLSLIYKRYISLNYEDLWARRDELSEGEVYSLTYLEFNPRLLIVFDDCAAELKSLFNKDIFRKFFYQNRHNFLTVILCCQDDTDLPANLRKNAYVSFFTSAVVCTSNFERATNKFPKPVKTFVNDAVGDVFVGNRKFAYIREDARGLNYYHVEVPYTTAFRFGSDAIHELCDSVKSTGTAIDADNPYYEYFKI